MEASFLRIVRMHEKWKWNEKQSKNCNETSSWNEKNKNVKEKKVKKKQCKKNKKSK